MPKTIDSLYMQRQRVEEIEKVLVAVDVMNLWHCGHNEFGGGSKVNYYKLIELIENKQLDDRTRDLDLHAYTVTSHTRKMPDGSIEFVGPRNQNFLEFLERIGFEVHDRKMRNDKSLRKPFATDWDVGIALDVAKKIDNYDSFALVSGDGDYAILLDEMRKQGKFVEVYTFRTAVSRLLRKSAHRIIHLTKNEIFTETRSYGEEASNKEAG
jgi:uncharacterized LabA/DUF88 family protein